MLLINDVGYAEHLVMQMRHTGLVRHTMIRSPALTLLRQTFKWGRAGSVRRPLSRFRDGLEMAQKISEIATAARLEEFFGHIDTLLKYPFGLARHGECRRSGVEMQGNGEVSSAKARCVGRRWRPASAELRAAREFASS
jgi:hypothetical protein